MGLVPTINLSNVAVTRGLVGYWLGGTQGVPKLGTVRDLSGNGNNGTCVADAYVGREGGVLDGTGDYISIGNYPIFDFENYTPFSVFMWCKISSLAANRFLVAKELNSVPYRGWYTIVTTAGKYTVVFQSNATVYKSVQTNYTLSTGVWYHLGFSHSGEITRGVGPIAFYRNGNYDPDDVCPSDVLDANTIASSASLNIGARDNGGVPHAGDIADVRIYNRALSAAEINQIYDTTKWRFR